MIDIIVDISNHLQSLTVPFPQSETVLLAQWIIVLIERAHLAPILLALETPDAKPLLLEMIRKGYDEVNNVQVKLTVT